MAVDGPDAAVFNDKEFMAPGSCEALEALTMLRQTAQRFLVRQQE